MEDDDRELIRHLFASLSARLENAHQLSVDGQAKSLAAQQQGELATLLETAASEVAVLAGALVVLTGSGSR